MNLIKIKLHSVIPENYSGICEYSNGDKEWYLNGQLHRDDGPAFESIYGDKWWYLNGKKHRDDGPAVELKNGGKYWFFNGQRHRIDGPAIEHFNGDKSWFLNGFNYPQEEWFEKLSDEDKLKAIWNLR
jgi:hypothetical protein